MGLSPKVVSLEPSNDVRDGAINQRIKSILYDSDHMNDFLDMVAEVVRSVRQS